MLANFDGSSPLHLETEAAQSKGLGMALWQQSSTTGTKMYCSQTHVQENNESRAGSWASSPQIFVPLLHFCCVDEFHNKIMVLSGQPTPV